MKKVNLRKIFCTMLTFVLMFTVALFGLKANAAVIETKGIDIVYSNPGEDCSTQVTISWHAKTKQSQLTYTVKSDPEYQNAISITATGEFDNTSFTNYDVAEFYKCRVELTDLTPDTEYIYKISTRGYVTDEYTFKTAGAAEFTFAYMSDIHAVPYDNVGKDSSLGITGLTAVKKMQTVQSLLNAAERVNNDKLAFIITTGDEVWRGSQYSNWLEWSKTQYTSAVKDYLWLSCPGNHEYYTQTNSSVWNYYPEKYASNTGAIYSDPQYFYNTYFNAVKAVPQNGPKDVSSAYYTLYNNILFVCIDSMMSSEYGKLNQLRAWFEEVCTANEGKYQYLIVYQHYPWYDFVSGEDKYARKWNDLFDKYGVDLALSGHMHGYLRTKPLNSGKVNEDSGTVYVVSPQVGDRPKVISGYLNEGLFAYRESTINWLNYSALSTITVNNEGLTYKLIDMTGEIHDQFTITAKRNLTISDNIKQSVAKSLTLSAYNGTVMCDFKDSLSVYVKSMAIQASGKETSTNPSVTRMGSLSLSGISGEKCDVRVRIEFIDSSVYEETLSVLTCPTLGLISDLRAESQNGKMMLNWQVSDASLVTEYKIYLNGELLGTASSPNYGIELAKVSFDTKYTLEAYSGSKLVYTKDFYYNIYGDVNLDGAITSADVNALIDMILSGYSFNDGAVKLLDNNNDGKVDIGDAYKILAYEDNLVEHIVYNQYEVVFIGLNNTILSKVKVTEGENAVAPTVPEISGYEFKGWSTSFTNVTTNIIVRAIYEEK